MLISATRDFNRRERTGPLQDPYQYNKKALLGKKKHLYKIANSTQDGKGRDISKTIVPLQVTLINTIKLIGGK